jgi:hypothetical protein
MSGFESARLGPGDRDASSPAGSNHRDDHEGDSPQPGRAISVVLVLSPFGR